MTPCLRVAAAALLVCAPALVGCSIEDAAPVPESQDSARMSGIYVVECVPGNLVQEPAQLPTACADGNEVLEELMWEDWGSGQARAEGWVVVNDCEPTCAEGAVSRHPVTVVLDRLQRGEAVGVYRRLEVTPVSDPPAHWDGAQVFPLPAAGG